MPQPKNRARSTAKRRRQTFLVPDAIRSKVVGVHAHIDFSLGKSDAATFRKLWRPTCGDEKSGFAASASTDKETALRVTGRGLSRCAVIDFRRGQIAPYPKIPARDFKAILTFINERGRSLSLSYWRQTLHAVLGEKDKERGLRTLIARLSESKLSLGTSDAMVTGIEFGSRSKDWAVFLGWSGGGEKLTFFGWAKTHRDLFSLEDGLAEIPAVLAEMV